MSAWRTADVLILGAGPAGCCAALRLLQLGYDVALVERALTPPPNVGESLTPGIKNIHDMLELNDIVARLPSRQAPERTTLWEHTTPDIHIGAAGNTMVERAGYDLALRQAVIERGGYCLAPASVITLSQHAGAWDAILATPAGPQTIQARFVIDARGRRHTGGAMRTASAAPLLAAWTDLEAGPQSNLVEAHAHGWLWGAARPDGRFRVMGFCDPFAVRGRAPAEWLAEHMAASTLFRLPIGGPVQACAATAEFDETAWQPGYLKTGDAAFTLDPLSSSGVEKAMRFALQTVVATHTALCDPDAQAMARNFYEERLAEAVARHHQWTRDFYELAWPDQRHGFWRTRRAAFSCDAKLAGGIGARVRSALAAPEHPTQVAATLDTQGQLLHGDVRLCGAIRIVELPCVVADRVQLRRAISHPNLARPVAFVEGAEIVPLLEVLVAVPRLPTAVQLWANCMPQANAIRVAGWLCRHGLLRAD